MSNWIQSDLTPALEWRDVTLDLGEFAIRDVSLRLEPRTWMCVIGPTGAGKTLVLEIAAGFLRPTRGQVFRGGENITRVPPERRRIAYIPQDDLLFPHLDVRANLLYGSRGEREELEHRLHSVAADLRISHLLDRRVHVISGGEAQRVALGRGLLADADVLLLDECTSALDEETREIVGDFLLEQRSQREISVIHVTHDSAEAERLADVTVTMAAGRITRIETNDQGPGRGRSEPGAPAPLVLQVPQVSRKHSRNPQLGEKIWQ